MNVDEKLDELFNEASPYPVAAIGGRLYAHTGPARATKPYAVFQRISRRSTDVHDQQTNLSPMRQWHYQVKFYDELRDRNLATVESFLSFALTYSHPAGIHSFVLLNQIEIWEEKEKLNVQVVDLDIKESLPNA